MANLGDTVFIVEADRFGEIAEILADGTVSKVTVPKGTTGEYEIIETSELEVIVVTLFNVLTRWLLSSIKKLFKKKKATP